MTRPNAQQLIDLLGLETLHGEGGLFIRSYCSEDVLPLEGLPARYRPARSAGTAKPASTAIYYLLTNEPDSFSALHRLPTDEIYHFYLGDPVQLLLLHTDGKSQRVTLGQNILSGQCVQFVAPRGVWQGSRLLPGGEFALLGTTMAPGYTDDDYQGGQREALLAQYPHEAEWIRALTRSER